MDQPWFPDAARSRAVLIGVSRFESEELPAIPAVRANLNDLRAALTDPAFGSIDADPGNGCRVLVDDASQADVGAALAAGSRQATDLLLVYYSGHGLLDDDGRLHLALRTTSREHPGWTAIPLDLIKRELGRARAKARVLVLDCCFSGQAVEAMADPAGLAAGQLHLTGTFTLTSTTANEPSNAPRGARNTAFTGAFLTALASPQPLTLEGIYRHTDHELAGLGLPRPQCRSVNTARDLTLVRGPSPRRDRPEPAPSAPPDPAPSATSDPAPSATADPAPSSAPKPKPTPAPEPTPRVVAAPPRPAGSELRPPGSEPRPTPSARPAPGGVHPPFALEPGERPASALPKAILYIVFSVGAAIVAWIGFTDPFRNADPSWFEIAVGMVFGGFFAVCAIVMAGLAILGLRRATRRPAAPWTRLEISGTGIVVTRSGERREVPWEHVERVKLARPAAQPASVPPTVMLALHRSATRLGSPGLPDASDRAGVVVLGQCRQWSDLLAALRRFAPPTVRVDRTVGKLPRPRTGS